MVYGLGSWIKMDFVYKIREKCSSCGVEEDYETNFRVPKGKVSGFCRYCREECLVLWIKQINPLPKKDV